VTSTRGHVGMPFIWSPRAAAEVALSLRCMHRPRTPSVRLHYLLERVLPTDVGNVGTETLRHLPAVPLRVQGCQEAWSESCRLSMDKTTALLFAASREVGLCLTPWLDDVKPQISIIWGPLQIDLKESVYFSDQGQNPATSDVQSPIPHGAAASPSTSPRTGAAAIARASIERA